MRRENLSLSTAQLTAKEVEAIKRAEARGWLIISPAIGDLVLTYWQRDCERFARPFAVLRQEPQRATLWLVLASGREWSEDEQRRVNAVLAAATGFVVTRNSVRAFADSAAAARLMRRLMAVTAF